MGPCRMLAHHTSDTSDTRPGDGSIGTRPPDPAADTTEPNSTNPARLALSAREPNRHLAPTVGLPGTRPIDHIPTGATTSLNESHHPADPTLAVPPVTVPGYELIAPLGEGGMGVVWKARQVKLNRVVALKMMLGGNRAGAKEVIRFLAEAEAVAAVKHPHVVQVYEYGEAGGLPFLAMEYLSGGSLTDRLKDNVALPPTAAAELVGTLAGAVQAAHALGEVVHRDLKPGNVLYDETGKPRVTDFGLAKRGAGCNLTATQSVMGTPAYMAPEQARGDTKFVGPQADVYSLGVILYECLTGTRPFDDANPMALMRRVAEEAPERPGLRVPRLPRDVELVCLKCLAKDPAERYATAGALATELGRFAAGEPVSVRAAGAVERGYKWARRNPTRASAYALTLTVLVLLGFGASLATLWRAAERAKYAAELALDGEAKAKREAEDAGERLAAVEYGRTMQAAHQEWRENNPGAALALLDSTPAHLRGWEWRYVHRLCHADLLTFKVHSESVRTVSFSPDGSRLVTAGNNVLASKRQDMKARVWDANTGAEVLALKGHSSVVLSASFSPDGSRVLTGSYDNTAKVWDAKSGSEILTLKGHAGGVVSAAFSPDGSRLVTGSGDRTAKVWNAQNGAEVLTLKGHAAQVVSTSFSPDGSRVATAGSYDRTAKVWDAQSGAEILTLTGHTREVNSVSFSPDGSRVSTVSSDGTVKVWDAKSSADVVTLMGNTPRLSSPSFSPDGSRVIALNSDTTATLWDVRSGAEVVTLKGHSGTVRSACFSPDGSRVLTEIEDPTATLWDVRSGAEVVTLKGHSEVLTSARFSPDGSRVVTASDDRTAKVWDARSGAEVFTLMGHTGLVFSASFSPDGSHLLTVSSDGTAKVWDAKNGAEVFILKGHSAGIVGTWFSPDGSRLLTSSYEKTVRVWDVKTWAVVLTLKGHGNDLTSVPFSPDGLRLITVSGSQATVWEAKTATEVLTLKGHSDGVSSSFSPDGSRVVTASADRTVKLWDARTGAEVLTLKGHSDQVWSASFSPDGSRLLTASLDGTAKVWDSRPIHSGSLAQDDALRLIRSLLERVISEAELRDRIEAANTISPETRAAALKLAKDSWATRIQERASNLVGSLFSRLLLRADVLDSLRTDPELDPDVRAVALDLAEAWREWELAINEAALMLVKCPGYSQSDSRRGLRLAEAAYRLEPDNAGILNTLGVAQYRMVQYEKARDTLMRSNRLNGNRNPADLAFLAMSQHQPQPGGVGSSNAQAAASGHERPQNLRHRGKPGVPPRGRIGHPDRFRRCPRMCSAPASIDEVCHHG